MSAATATIAATAAPTTVPVVLDTSVIVDVLRGDPRAERAWVDVRVSRRCLVSTLTIAELVTGLRRGEEDRLAAVLRGIEVVPVGLDLAATAGRLAALWRRSHPGVGLVDHVIAATTVTAGAELWALGVDRFPMFVGLEPPW